MKLTTADYNTLVRAKSLRERFESGIFPTGSSQHRHFAKLVDRGLLSFDGWGRDIDGLCERDVMVYQLTKAGISAVELQEAKRLRRVIEKPEHVHFWGRKYTITPRLISRVFGNGRYLLCVTPLAARPNYFVVRIDSSIKKFDACTSFPVTSLRYLVDEIIEAAEEEYGYFGDEEYREANGDESRGFPVCDWGIGVTWGRPFPIAEWGSP